jgi:hypothetical protein
VTSFRGCAAGAAALILGIGPSRLAAQSADAAATLVNRVVADVQGVINSGRGESAMLREFERIFRTYADVPTIGNGHRPAGAVDQRLGHGRLRSGIPGLHGPEIRAPFPGIHRRPDQRHGHPPDGAVRRGALAGPHSRQFARSSSTGASGTGAGRPLLSTSSSKA